MPGGRPASFNCPHCQALYQVIKAEAGPETVDGAVPCRSCGEPLPGREGGFVLKNFLLPHAGWVQRRHDAGASRASRPSRQQHGSKQDRKGADADRDQDQLK
jgi:predicted Zn finger-like uncharacterized protein